jgi:thiamine biosynthesis lipoprotein
MVPVRPLIVLALIALRTGPNPALSEPVRQVPHEFAQVHMGMPVRIRLYSSSEAHARAAAAAAFARIAALDQVMSDYRPDSELRRLGRRWSPVSRELVAVVERAIEIADATGGAFDPTVGPLVGLWREARQSRRLPEATAIVAAKRLVGWQHVQLDAARSTVRLARDGVRLDLGGIAKGYIIQQALQAMIPFGVTSALVEAGGDIVVGEAPPGRDGWNIDVTGSDAEFAARAARLTNAALATSGPSAQFVEIDGVRYSHVVDPRTGLGLTNQVTARVIAADGATADALATALTVAPDSLLRIRRRFPDVAVSLAR